MPFSALTAFFPAWSVEEHIAVSALLGGIPAYLGWLDPDWSAMQASAVALIYLMLGGCHATS